jgi:hypothetical protein
MGGLMHTEYVRGLRDKLQKRVHRLKSTEWQLYIGILRQFLNFIDGEPTFAAICEELKLRFPNAKAVAQQISSRQMEMSEDEQEWAAVSLEMIRRFAREDDPTTVNRFVPQQQSGEFQAYIQAFGELYLNPVHGYLDERLVAPQFILSHLIRFKHLCEWFWRNQMYEAWTREPSRGEKLLAIRLYEFLFTEGITLFIEPSSASGEADMVSSQIGTERLLADAKIFNPDKSKGPNYILQGFRQLYQYTCDYNEPMGYLIIFNTSDKQLKFSVGAGGSTVPHVEANRKTIFFLVIDLYPHETSASKRPQPDVLEITEADIVGAATADSPTPDPPE